MTITIDVSAEEAERLAGAARRTGRDLPTFIRDVLQNLSLKDADGATGDEAESGDANAFFGIWSRREDLEDSSDWVTKERAAWRMRPGRPA